MYKLFKVMIDGGNKATIKYNKVLLNHMTEEELLDILDEEHKQKLMEVTNFILNKIKENNKCK